MVVISLIPHRGNGARSFPHTGYLGLCPVTLAGVVKTHLEEDRRPVEASSLVVRVRCYESVGLPASTSTVASEANSANTSPQMSRTCSVLSGSTFVDSEQSKSIAVGHGKGKVLYEQSLTLWRPNEGYRDGTSQLYGDLGDFESGFQLVIPTEAIHQGAKSTMIFKKWRIWWAVEAVISHKPSGMHGDRIVRSQQLALLNYSSAIRTSPLQWTSSFDNASTPEYTISGNTAFLGSSDPLSLAVRVRRNIQGESPKKITVELRREIIYSFSDSPTTSHGFDNRPTNGRRLSNFMGHRRTRSNSRRDSAFSDYRTHGPPTPPAYIPTPLEYQESAVDSYFGLFGPASTTETTRHHPFGQSPRNSATASRKKKEDTALAVFEADFRPEGHDAFSCQVKGDLPKARSLYHYALGESCTTSQGSSRFYLVLRLHYRSKNNVIELPHRTITFTTVSAAERQKATQQLSRIAAIQGAEAKLFRSMGKVSKGFMHEEKAEEAVKLSTVRRRSEHLDGATSPRTRLRFGSDPSDLSPVISSMLNSPSLSVASNATHRPRGPNKKQVSSIHSNRNLRPRSSGGLSTASSSRSLASISPNPRASNLSEPFQKIEFKVSPFLGYSPSIQDIENDNEAERLAKQPSIDFESFTLRPPPGKLQGMAVREEAVPPKASVRSRTRSSKAPSHRDSANVLPPSGASHSAPAFLELNDKLAKAVEEQLAQRDIITFPISSAPLAHPPIVSRTSSSSQSSQGLDASPTNINLRRKSGTNVLSSFFRRGSKVSA